MTSDTKPIFFTIILVCLNAGEGLKETVDSVVSQSYPDYQLLIKDGGSTDNSLEAAKIIAASDKRISIYTKKDKSIYDAMNQALDLSKNTRKAESEYVVFMNAGDTFYDKNVLQNISMQINEISKKNGAMPDIIYGNMYHKALDTVIYPAPQINDFTCYRNVPCHQSCFYRREMFADRGYDIKYNVRADYEHFLWCYYQKHADIVYAPVMTAAYEGGGYSETKENRRLSELQHREIVMKYMGKAKAYKYRLIMLLTLAPLRRAMAESKVFSSIYNSIKIIVYKNKK